jgi:hypothetical protein
MPMATGVHTSEEVETTPRQRDVQALPVVSDGDIEFVEPEPYQTPVVLQKQKKRSAPAPVSDSEVEVSEVEERRQRKGMKGKTAGKRQPEVFVLFD